MTPEDQRLNTEERLRAIGQRGRLARWRAHGRAKSRQVGVVVINRRWRGLRSASARADRVSSCPPGVGLASLLKPPYLLPTSTSTVRSARLSERTTDSLKKDLTNNTSSFFTCANDDGLLDLLHGVGGEDDSEAFVPQRSAHIGRETLPVAAVVHLHHDLVGLQLTVRHTLVDAWGWGAAVESA